MRYILNSAVLTNFGKYEYLPLTDEEAMMWANNGPFLSTVGYEQTAEALSILLGRKIAVNRTTIQMQPGDSALVFRLAFPPGTERIDPNDKGRLAKAVLEGHYELGLLIMEPKL